ncbi:MAG: ATP-binding protein [Bacteroidales bacterium]|nr:ATP-binding protein [Bacteroidales bacterium]
MLKRVSQEQIIDRIKFENPWWLDHRIEKDFDDLPRRAYYKIFKPLASELEVRRAIVLMGPRRVGKTVMLHHLIQDLLDSELNTRKIVFITIENPIFNNIGLEDLFKYARLASGEETSEDWIVIFDEIQYLKNWEVHLKSLVDSYRSCKFIASGSAAAALKLKSTESGAGRFTDFMLPPLTFHEYISLKKLDQIMIPSTIQWNETIPSFFSTTHITELNKHFHDYINFGGYPEVIFSQKIQSNPGRYIRQDIVDKVLLRDLPSLYGIRDVQELNSFFTTIAYNTANEFSYERLSTQSGIQKGLTKKYIDYLEAAFLIKHIKRVDQAGKKLKRENFFKLYLTNPSLRSALFSPISQTDDLIGNLVETAIYSQWMHREWFTPWYARWNNGEVDMVGISEKTLKPTWALEIKWSNKFFEKPYELKSLIKFCKMSNLERALVTTIDKEGIREVDGILIQFVPAATYAYTIGRNTLNRKTTRE